MLIAYCFASGQIEFGSAVPDGGIEIARGTDSVVRQKITATSRLAHDNKTLLIPGVPEAKATDRIEALLVHVLWLKQRETKQFRVAGKPCDPFDRRHGSVIGAQDRIECVKVFDRIKCMEAILVPHLQNTVRKAIDRRLRQLLLSTDRKAA